MKITLTEFAGMSPMLDTRILNEKACLLCENANVESGKVVPAWVNTAGWESGATNGNSVTSPVNEQRVVKTYTINNGQLECNGSLVKKFIPTVAPTVAVTKRMSDTSMLGNMSVEYIYRRTSGSNIYSISKEDATAPDSLDIKAKCIISAWTNNKTTTGHGMLGYYFAKCSGSILVLYNYLKPDGTIITSSATIDYKEGAIQSGSVDIPLGDQSNVPYARVSLSSVRMDDITSPSAPQSVDYYAYEGCTHHYNLKIRYSYPLETRYYMFTYYYGDSTGEAYESPNSPISTIVQCRRGDIVKVTITKPSSQDAGSNVKGVYVYRTAGSAKGGSASFYLVKDIPVSQFTGNTATFTDDVLDSQLGEKHMDVQNPPNSIIAGTLYKVNGSLVVCTSSTTGSGESSRTYKKNIWLSEPYMPYNFPVANNYVTDDNIVSISVVGSTVIILTDKNAYTLVGSTAVAMTLKKSVYEYPCSSANSVVSADGVTYYASPDGIIRMEQNGECQNITENIFTKKQWEWMNPSSMTFKVKGNTIVIDVTEMTTGEGDTARQYSLVWDMAKKNMTTQQYTAPTTVELTWRSKIFTFDTPIAPSVARIITSYQKSGSSSTTSFRLLSVSRESTPSETVAKPYSIYSLPAHAVQVYPATAGTYQTVVGDRAFRLPHMRKELGYIIEIKSQDKIVRVDLATSMGELGYVNDRQE